MSFIEKILKRLPHKDIVKKGVLYLRRHFLSLNFHWLPRLYLHLINRPDGDRDPHCHPGNFLTIPLFGGYWEDIYETPVQITGQAEPKRHFARPFVPAYRRAEFVHKLIDLPKGRAWTLVLFWPNRRVWGFWTPQGFVPEKQYINAEDRLS